MICPHCKKPVTRSVSAEVKRKAIALSKQGYSARDIQCLLGGAISFASVSRLLREKNRGLEE